MAYKKLALDSLVVNPANDRHGELENETAAIARLFATQEPHMRSLAKDLVTKGEVFEPPLVFPNKGKYIVADGNRRTTCLKLLNRPRRAPTVELQEFFADLKKNWNGALPNAIECRIETDRDRVDDILFRRHTGVQGGIGQSTWDDRMKNNFVIRTGKSTGFNLADEIEKKLSAANLMPNRKIPRSNMNRLLSAEAVRNKLGFSVRKGKFEFVLEEVAVLNILSRIANDLATKEITLEQIWSTGSKLEYIDKLGEEGVLPPIDGKPNPSNGRPRSKLDPAKPPKPKPAKPPKWPHLIPEVDYGVVWPARLQRHREIWQELQFKLELSEHPNAISVLLRVLLELSIDNYIKQTSLATIHENDKLAKKASKVAAAMEVAGKIDKKYRDAIGKLERGEELISMDTLNRYVHSPNFNVSRDHLKMLWNTLSNFVVCCLSA